MLLRTHADDTRMVVDWRVLRADIGLLAGDLVIDERTPALPEGLRSRNIDPVDLVEWATEARQHKTDPERELLTHRLPGATRRRRRGGARHERLRDRCTGRGGGDAVEAYLRSTGIGESSKRIYRISLTTWAWLTCGQRPPLAKDRRGAQAPVTRFAALNEGSGDLQAPRRSLR
jgi:hypothetical protein